MSESMLLLPPLQTLQQAPFVVAVTVLLLATLYWMLTSTDIKRIDGIFEIPNALPMFGHLFALGEDQATAFEDLRRKFKHSVFQVRLGQTRAIVLNSFDDCRRMYISHQSSVIDRPVLHTIAGVAKTKGLTIGTSPWNDSTKRRRKVAGTTLSRPQLRNYFDMLDLESFCVVRDLEKAAQHSTVEVSVKSVIQRYALNSTLTLCYGVRMDGVYDEMLKEILDVGHQISTLRGTSENLQDFVPVLRYLPNNKKNRLAKELSGRRDKYLDSLLEVAKERVQLGIDRECVYSAVLRDDEAKLSKQEISTTCLSMVSGGFETVPGTLISCIGSLSTLEGQSFQKQALDDIYRYYGNIEEAWAGCIREEKVPFINAIVKETLRYYTVLSMGQPRKTTREIIWDKAVIPVGTMILFNTQAANHDASHFGSTADSFDPTRWLQPDSAVPKERESTGLQHFGFGGGSRQCPGIALAQRMLYAALVRLLTSYRIEASEVSPPTTHFSEYNTSKTALVAIPKDFKVSLRARDPARLDAVLKDAEERTARLA